MCSCLQFPSGLFPQVVTDREHCRSTTLAKKIETATQTKHMLMHAGEITWLSHMRAVVSIFLARVVLPLVWHDQSTPLQTGFFFFFSKINVQQVASYSFIKMKSKKRYPPERIKFHKVKPNQTVPFRLQTTIRSRICGLSTWAMFKSLLKIETNRQGNTDLFADWKSTPNRCHKSDLEQQQKKKTRKSKNEKLPFVASTTQRTTTVILTMSLIRKICPLTPSVPCGGLV